MTGMIYAAGMTRITRMIGMTGVTEMKRIGRITVMTRVTGMIGISDCDGKNKEKNWSDKDD